MEWSGTRFGLWWVTCITAITANRFRFGFGRQANRTLKDIDLPSPKEMPEWVSKVGFQQTLTKVLDQIKQTLL
jgi:hypothetical protein